jgi:hypothetical protein
MNFSDRSTMRTPRREEIEQQADSHVYPPYRRFHHLATSPVIDSLPARFVNLPLRNSLVNGTRTDEQGKTMTSKNLKEDCDTRPDIWSRSLLLTLSSVHRESFDSRPFFLEEEVQTQARPDIDSFLASLEQEVQNQACRKIFLFEKSSIKFASISFYFLLDKKPKRRNPKCYEALRTLSRDLQRYSQPNKIHLTKSGFQKTVTFWFEHEFCSIF